MNNSKRTLWAGIAALCLLACALTLGYAWYASVSETRDNDWKTDMKMEGIRLTLSDLAEAQAQADSDFVQQLRDNLALLSIPLQNAVRQEGDAAIQNYVYGCVLRKDESGFVLPEDTSSLPLLEPQEYEDMPYTPDPCKPFEDREGFFWSLLENAPQEGEEDAAITAAAAEAAAENAAESAQDGTAEDTAESGAEDAEKLPAEQAEQPPEEAVTAEEEPENHYVLCAYRQLTGSYY